MAVNEPCERQLALPALVEAVETAPAGLERLLALAQLTSAATAAVRKAVDEARAAGASWAEVALALGSSRQAAQQRYGPRPEPKPGADGELAVVVRKPRGWAVTTPAGRTLLRVRKD
jgi:hypothetical protein